MFHVALDISQYAGMKDTAPLHLHIFPMHIDIKGPRHIMNAAFAAKQLCFMFEFGALLCDGLECYQLNIAMKALFIPAVNKAPGS